MNSNESFPRPWLCGALILLLASACGADDAPKPDSSLEIINYKTPIGWKVSDGGGKAARVFTAPDANGAQQAIIIIVLSPAQDGLDLGVAFDAAVKEVTSNGKVLESGEVSSSKTRQGFDALSRTLVTQNAAEQRIYVRMVAAKVQNRMAGIYFLATSKDLYDQHQAEMAALLQSVSFAETAGAANPLGAQAAGVNPLGANPIGASAELAGLEKQKQELLAKIAEIEARQRQLTAGVAPAARAAAPADGEQLLAIARERFAKDLAGRRKPHTIAGDILGLDGKPIPNVAVYRVSVWGTTIAAERTQYGLEVDKNGHFEQQVPDGLYQIKATCIVEHAGHRLPVDLVWLDDKKVGVDQASAGGIVRDWVMVINGPRPGEDPKGDRAYFGGVIKVNGPTFDLTRGHLSTRYPGAKVQFTLAAQGPLIDGSRLDPITIDIGVAELNYSSTRRNIPIGVYKASATLIAKDGGKLPLKCARSFESEYGDSVEVFWESARDDAEHRVDPGVYLKD